MDVPRLIRTHVSTSELEPPQELVKGERGQRGSRRYILRLGPLVDTSYSNPGVNDGSTPLLEVVKALGEYLTSSEDDVRLKGESRVVRISQPHYLGSVPCLTSWTQV
jgi:DNA repair/transcription protein MET18/MMS19